MRNLEFLGNGNVDHVDFGRWGDFHFGKETESLIGSFEASWIGAQGLFSVRVRWSQEVRKLADL